MRWLGVVLVFFSIPQSKPICYVHPALPPLAVLVALTAAPLLQSSRRAIALWRFGALVAAGTCVAVTIGFARAHPKSSHELTARLAASRSAGDGVAFLDEYRYDVAFYLHTSTALFAVANWDPALVRQHDNWRKELADAGGYAPTLATDRLIGDIGFRSALCSRRVRWVMARVDSRQTYPFLSVAQQVAIDHGSALWHTDGSEPRFAAAVGCGTATPSATYVLNGQ